MDKRVGLKRYELNGRKVLFYFDEVSKRRRRREEEFLPSPASAQELAESFLCGDLFALLHVGVIWGVFIRVCRPLSDPQPVHDVRGLQSCQGVRRRQDGTCPGQDLRLLRTRWAWMNI